MRRILLAGAAATALATAALAIADTTVIHDPLGDSSGGPAFDIRRAVAGHANGRLEHIVVVEDADRFTKRETFIFIHRPGSSVGYVVSTHGVRRMSIARGTGSCSGSTPARSAARSATGGRRSRPRRMRSRLMRPRTAARWSTGSDPTRVSAAESASIG